MIQRAPMKLAFHSTHESRVSLLSHGFVTETCVFLDWIHVVYLSVCYRTLSNRRSLSDRGKLEDGFVLLIIQIVPRNLAPDLSYAQFNSQCTIVH